MKIAKVDLIAFSFLTLLILGMICGLAAAMNSTLCPNGLTICNGTHCVDLKSDESACGSCDHICAMGYACLNSTCACLSGETSCNGSCVVTASDPNNCGKCGVSCPATQYCNNGTCICTTGNIFCNRTCVDGSFDDNNCGGCGNVCQSGTLCSEGACWSYGDVAVLGRMYHGKQLD